MKKKQNNFDPDDAIYVEHQAYKNSLKRLNIQRRDHFKSFLNKKTLIPPNTIKVTVKIGDFVTEVEV